jgi:hypothetical protein
MREIVKFRAKSGICQQVKVEHQKPTGKLQSLLIFGWKWEDITMDYLEVRRIIMLYSLL